MVFLDRVRWSRLVMLAKSLRRTAARLKGETHTELGYNLAAVSGCVRIDCDSGYG